MELYAALGNGPLRDAMSGRSHRLRGVATATLLAAFVIARPVHAAPSPAWKLVFAKATTRETIPDSGRPEEPSGAQDTGTPLKAGAEEPRSETVVLLSPSWLSIREGDSESVYDFSGRRIHHLDHRAGAVWDYSLFADIGFRDLEIQNRTFLSDVLSKAGVSEPPLELVETETLFSIEADPPADPKVRQEAAGDVTVFWIVGRPVVRYRAAPDRLPELYRPTLLRFLVYGATLHPRIHDRLRSEGRVPMLLEYGAQDMRERKTVRLELRESAQASLDWSAHLADFRPVTREVSSGIGIAERILRGEIAAKPVPYEEYQRRSREAVRDKSYTDALLAQFESEIATGRSDSKLVAKIMEAGSDDPGVRALVDGLDTDDAKESVRLLDSIDRNGLRYAHVLHVFRANSIAEAGNTDEAIEDFARALGANPYLVGAYKDLGGLYYGNYEMADAWTCWDAARKIMADHPMLQDVKKLESHLLKEYPRFF